MSRKTDNVNIKGIIIVSVTAPSYRHSNALNRNSYGARVTDPIKKYGHDGG